MGMSVGSGSGSGEPEVMSEMNTTPLIDVMLVLLIMLIITIPIQLHNVELNLPAGNPPPQTVIPEVVQVDINAAGVVSWNGETIADREVLDSKLSGAAAQDVQPELHLRADRNAPYKAVAAVLASAQRLGANKLGLVGNEQFAQ
ncbi:biopolymer transporter ExbD [Herminiimonas sp. KBW02]|jgi:biopolymer transport protein ExbD|uniref:Biopolymer transporter ExbD n=1 Tax=Herminiimonas contaminans TaxID=1111140 RepID=A0ABS0ER90_9BURK|nr:MULTISPECIES: biopolymer transporter ExbD [Oxalobacteraceae]MBF8177368.1 biopolymer transporter ExbD [Herminiimonas contaminans]MBX9798441.1 biopolymer transporter ExbD [Burkholderiaceae bacterium]RQO34321.1 biopolymer transporter ExbD [Herminiimonas sp. KBW02]